MKEANTKPVIFLPENSGRDRVEGGAYLRNLPIEEKGKRFFKKIRLTFAAETISFSGIVWRHAAIEQVLVDSFLNKSMCNFVQFRANRCCFKL